MSLTREQVESTLFRRLGPSMARADMETLHDGEGPSFADPIGWALRELEYPNADVTDPTSAEVSAVTDADLDWFLDLAQWRLLDNIIGNLDDSDERLGPSGQWNSQFADQMQEHQAHLEDRLRARYGWGPPTLVAGTIRVVTVQEES